MLKVHSKYVFAYRKIYFAHIVFPCSAELFTTSCGVVFLLQNPYSNDKRPVLYENCYILKGILSDGISLDHYKVCEHLSKHIHSDTFFYIRKCNYY